MKINPTAACHLYGKVAEYTHQPRQEERPQAAANTDQIQISAEGSRKQEIEQLSRSVSARLNQPASPQRLAALRQAVQSDNYYVPTQQLVDAVMRHWAIL